jgi:outer membrane immunogenic protein
MKRLVIWFAIAAAALSGVNIASAADMAAVKKAPPAPVAPDWSGFYMGLHGGWGFANSTATSRTDSATLGSLLAPASFDAGDSGSLFGVQAGYNWQFGNWVLGVEGDISGVGIGGFDSDVPLRTIGLGAPALRFGADNFMRQEINWLASARGRLGYASGAGLIYATAGAAWANVDYQANTSDDSILCAGAGCAWPAAFSDTRLGWVVGGGYEWAAASNWTLRGEYLFYSFGGASTTASTMLSGGTCTNCSTTYNWGDFDIHAVRLGLNYRWDRTLSAQMQGQPVSTRRSWTGFYAGLHGGWAFARANASYDTAITDFLFAPGAFDLNDSGPLFGGQIGYNWQTANWMLGVEADLSGTGIRGFQSQPPFCIATDVGCGFSGPVLAAGSFMRQDVNWLASLRGRVGHVWGPGLIYVTGGAAWANIDYQANLTGRFGCGGEGCAFPIAFSKTQSGWTIGGGYEWPAWSNWTLRGEYLFYRFGGVSTTAAAVSGALSCPAACSVTYRWNDLDIHTLRVGLNYTW